MRIGLISDTHGLLRPEVFTRLAGVERILHAGDVGSPDILVELEAIAPVTAVYGNTDGFEIRARLPAVAALELSGLDCVVIHGDQFGTPTPALLRKAYPTADLIVYGHTHRPLIDHGGGRLVINPGSAGPRRFDIEPSIGLLTITDGKAEAEIVKL